jgi:N-methylhydantoinase A/oxoprolinase/acetone carboxylase beta subunit
MSLALGVDTGGTFTDAVLIDQHSGEILNSAKELTTRHNLSLGIKNSLIRILKDPSLPISSSDIQLVSLSTTLATNAITEGYGGDICLLLIGYDQHFLQKNKLQAQLLTENIIHLQGGHDIHGNEQAPLDLELARQAILARKGQVEAFAVSSYFANRNPEHELEISKLVQELTGLPATCGHELSSNFDSLRRAITVVLNTRLIPLLRELIYNLQQTLQDLHIQAPLMVVKGDGSLLQAELAIQKPIETILSGPAASAVGVKHLSGHKDVVVVDMGGTTSDIAILQEGYPRLNQEGAKIQDKRTLIEAVNVHTAGIGGDSLVSISEDGGLSVGPQRVVPLCALASKYPEILSELRRQLQEFKPSPEPAHFVLPWRQAHNALPEKEAQIFNYLSAGPSSIASLIQKNPFDFLLRQRVQKMEQKCLLQRSGFTPSDALHVLGKFSRWEGAASELACELLSLQSGIEPEELCAHILEEVNNQLATRIISTILEEEGFPPNFIQDSSAEDLLHRGLHKKKTGDLAVSFCLRQALVGIGAPVQAYLPAVAQKLNTQLIIPRYAEVANAVGAVTGGIVQRKQVQITPLQEGKIFRLHLPEGIQDFSDLEGAVQYAKTIMYPYMQQLAQEAGGEGVQVAAHRSDRLVRATGQGQKVYLGTNLNFTAIGRPKSL